MPATSPVLSSGARDPRKRARPIPRPVRDAITLMVYGKIDDPDCAPLTFIEAAKLSGIKPDVMRRYLDRADVRVLLRAERRAFRDAICAGNEQALRRVRDKSANGMVTVAAVRALEAIDKINSTHRQSADISPRLTIVVRAAPPAPTPPMTIERRPVTIEARPIEPRRDEHGRRLDELGRPAFDPNAY